MHLFFLTRRSFSGTFTFVFLAKNNRRPPNDNWILLVFCADLFLHKVNVKVNGIPSISEPKYSTCMTEIYANGAIGRYLTVVFNFVRSELSDRVLYVSGFTVQLSSYIRGMPNVSS